MPSHTLHPTHLSLLGSGSGLGGHYQTQTAWAPCTLHWHSSTAQVCSQSLNLHHPLHQSVSDTTAHVPRIRGCFLYILSAFSLAQTYSLFVRLVYCCFCLVDFGMLKCSLKWGLQKLTGDLGLDTLRLWDRGSACTCRWLGWDVAVVWMVGLLCFQMKVAGLRRPSVALGLAASGLLEQTWSRCCCRRSSLRSPVSQELGTPSVSSAHGLPIAARSFVVSSSSRFPSRCNSCWGAPATARPGKRASRLAAGKPCKSWQQGHSGRHPLWFLCDQTESVLSRPRCSAAAVASENSYLVYSKSSVGKAYQDIICCLHSSLLWVFGPFPSACFLSILCVFAYDQWPPGTLWAWTSFQFGSWLHQVEGLRSCSLAFCSIALSLVWRCIRQVLGLCALGVLILRVVTTSSLPSLHTAATSAASSSTRHWSSWCSSSQPTTNLCPPSFRSAGCWSCSSLAQRCNHQVFWGLSLVFLHWFSNHSKISYTPSIQPSIASTFFHMRYLVPFLSSHHSVLLLDLGLVKHGQDLSPWAPSIDSLTHHIFLCFCFFLCWVSLHYV